MLATGANSSQDGDCKSMIQIRRIYVDRGTRAD